MSWVNDHEILSYFANRQSDITREEEVKYLKVGFRFEGLLRDEYSQELLWKVESEFHPVSLYTQRWVWAPFDPKSSDWPTPTPTFALISSPC